ncbi:MAG: 2-C-methyl-D-erythritol 4-phosphate cytidylyltransferase, partial [Proteobacteria bacterium]|nr:2-C-methyl-D-erythritol 4-phosphate cytidylyltransferase [Pseudomonadota bacterium]
PVIFSRDAVLAGYATAKRIEGGSDPSLLEILKHGGVQTRFVSSTSLNIKITTASDLRLAEALLAVG